MKMSVLMFACFSWALCSAEMRQLDDYIKHYEELSYSTQNLHNKHMRAKRSTGSKSLDLKFKAHSREFHLDLKPSTSSFTKSYRSTHNNGTEDPADLAILYEGSESQVVVFLGIFRGTIMIPGDTVFQIEPAYRFYGLEEARKLPYHSVIYKNDHVDTDPFRHKRSADSEAGRCALEKYRSWMVRQTEAEVNIRNKRSNYIYKDSMLHNKYTVESNRARNRREMGSGCTIGAENTCILYMRSDPTLFNKFKADLGGTLRNEWLMVSGIVNCLWIVIIMTLSGSVDLQIAGTNPLSLVFLIVFSFLFVLQFFCMLVHRFTTLSHFIARAPYQFGQSYWTSISFLSRHLDPDEKHLLTEVRNSETVSRIKRDKSRKRKGTPGKSSEKSKLLPNHHSNDVYSGLPSVVSSEGSPRV